MSTTSEENSIVNEIDMAKSVPKLKGASNWREWEVQMFMIFGFNNRVYVQLIGDEIKTPPSPVYEDPQGSVRALLFKEGNKDKEIRIMEAAIEACLDRRFQFGAAEAPRRW
ncbi:hypothetical protein N7465_004792 [Penicillium sp. CMV-2018d]|nr:hypothetical protein N7465_004792 [Penicillium sp. CMV-2018d]